MKLERKYTQLLIVAGFVLIPLVSAILFSLSRGGGLDELYLPASLWNDEILYYKQVQGFLDHGFSMGYFGYNESSAEIGSFGVWTPATFLVWLLWGKLFGWNISSPIICNIICMCLAYGIYASLVKPDAKELLAVAVCTSCFGVLNRYILSGMTEPIFLALCMVFIGLYRKCLSEGLSAARLICMDILCIYLTICRPYFFLGYILIGFLVIKEKRSVVSRLALQALIGLLSFVAFFIISSKFCAAYLLPSIKTDWIKLILEQPVAGIKDLVDTL